MISSRFDGWFLFSACLEKLVRRLVPEKSQVFTWNLGKFSWRFGEIKSNVSGSMVYPLVMTDSAIESDKIVVEIVVLPLQNGDFPWFFVGLPEDNSSHCMKLWGHNRTIMRK